MSRRRVVVIGAGPSGLCAAVALARAGLRPLVLETAGAVGGLSGSFDVAGFQLDHGPHRLHGAASSEVKALWEQAVGGALGERARRGELHLGGRRIPYPLTLPGLLRGLGPREAALHGLSSLAARLFRPAGEDFAGEAERRLGARAVEKLYGPAARKVWGLAPELLDQALGRARVQTRGPAALLRGALGRRRPGRRYFYPDRGFGSLSEGLASLVRAAGGEVRTGSRVEGLLLTRGKVVGVRCNGEELAASTVVATAPLPELCAWAGAAGAAEGLAFRALVLLFLELCTDRLGPNDVHYFADEAIPASRLFEAKAFTAGAGPEGRTVIGLDLPCAAGDATWNAGAEELLARVRPALAATGALAAGVLGATVRRLPAAYPIYRRGFAPLRAAALDALAGNEGLYPVGRSALFVHDNVHHACAAGLVAGRAAAAGASAASWRAAQAPLLEAVIED